MSLRASRWVGRADPGWRFDLLTPSRDRARSPADGLPFSWPWRELIVASGVTTGWRMAFFKRAQYDSPVGARQRASDDRCRPSAATRGLRAAPRRQRRRRSDSRPPTNCSRLTGLIGQDRALKAIQFGTNIKSHDFNIFVLGPPASGKTTAVKAHLGPKAAESPTPADWVYVYNFDNPNRPKALQLPHGPRQGAGQGHGGGARRAAKRAAGAVRERGLPGAPSRHRRAVPVRPGGGAGGAERQGARPRTSPSCARRPASPWRPCTRARSSSRRCSTRCPRPCARTSRAKIEALQKELGSILERMPKADKERARPAERAQRGGRQARRRRGARRSAGLLRGCAGGERLCARGGPRPDPQRRRSS